MRQRVFGAFFISAVLLTTVFSGASCAAEIFILPRVPVVGREVEFRVDAGAQAQDRASFMIIRDSATIAKGDANATARGYVFKWTPKETGFYKVQFASAGAKSVAQFPVVWRDLYFIAWPPLRTSESEGFQYLPSYVIMSGGPGSGYGEEDMKYWQERGCKALAYVSVLGGRIDMIGKEDEVVNQLAEQWGAPMKKGYDGVFMDEFGQYPKPELLAMVERTRKALIKLREQNPGMLIFPAVAGSLLPLEAIMCKDSDSIALLESYPNCFTMYFGSHSVKQHLDHRIDSARNNDLIFEYGRKHAAVILLGMNGCDSIHPEPASAELEDYIRYIKKVAPEMPGIGFYSAGPARDYLLKSGLYKAAERCCLDYYIKPVIDLRGISFSDYSPRTKKLVDVFVQVHNLGGMDARGVTIKLYAVQPGSSSRTLIGERKLERVACGYATLSKKDKKQPYEYQQVNDNTYAVIDDKFSTFNQAWELARFAWKPGAKGCWTIVAEVESSEQFTILDGMIQGTISVK